MGFFKRSTSSPPGSVVSHAGSALPDGGYLHCDGSAVSRTTFAALFNVIGTTYGNGNGSTTFNLPDFRGQFIRGLDNMGGPAGSAGVDSGRSLGTTQGQDTVRHTHKWYDAPNGNSFDSVGNIQSIEGSAANGNKNISTSATQQARVNADQWTDDAITQVGGETRPTNVAIKYFIKF